MKLQALPALAICATLVSQAFAGPLKEAKINHIVNDVKLVEPRQGARPAAVRDVVKDDLGVATGIQSRAELLFQDNTLTRLGAETFFSFQPGTRNLNLDRGSMLLQVPKNLGGARIRAASVTASITGTTIMMENLPGKAVKIVVLEGSLNVAVAGRPADRLDLRAGKMIIVTPEAKKLPQPVDVDLRKMVRTSALIDPVAFRGSSKVTIAALPSMGLIEKEMVSQESRLKTNGVTASTFTISGEGGATATDSGTKLATTDRDSQPAGLSADAAAPQTERETAVTMLKEEAAQVITTSPTLVGTRSGNVLDDVIAKDLLTAGDIRINAGQDSAAPGASTTPTGAQRLTATTSIATNTAPVTPPTAPVTPPTAPVTPPTTPVTPVTPVTPPTTPVTPPTIPVTPPAYITIPSPYVIDSTTTITTAGTTITTNGVTEAGGLYKAAELNGPASAYLFSNSSTFDTATRLDTKFSVMSGGSAPSGGVAVYRFGSLDIRKGPTFNTTGGPIDVALVSQTGFATNSSGNAWDVSPLRSLFLSTENGPINLGNEFKTSSGTFKYLQAYARGATGFFTLDGKINTPYASVFVDAEQGIRVTSSSSITALSTTFNTPGRIVIEKSPSSLALKLTSGTGIELTKALGSVYVEIAAPVLQTSADLSTLTGSLNIGAGGIQAGGAKLSGFDHIDVAGNVEAGSVSVYNGLSIGGTFKTGAANGAASLSAGTFAIVGGIDLTGAAASGAGGVLTLSGTDVHVASTGINGIKADGNSGLLTGSNGGTVNVGTSSRPITNSITVDQPISAVGGASAAGVATGGAGGSVNLVASGTVTVNSTVKVSESALTRANKKGGNITINSRKTTGTAIAVNNSGELVALLNSAAVGAGGKVTFTSSGGDILVNGGTVQADRGTIDIRNTGAGNVALTNANIRGDVVKVGALGANGQLIIGGGTISADTSLKLYGGTTNGQVRFTDNVTLGGSGTKAIAGKAVTIDNGKTVTVGGASAAKVFTDNANYTGSGGNGSTSGNFGGAGATTQAFNKKPAF